MSRGVRTPETTSSPCALGRKSPLGSGAPVTSSRENATPEPEVSPLLPNTICCTLTAVPQPAVGDRPLTRPGVEHRSDGQPQLLGGVLGKLVTGVLAVDLLEGLSQLLE